MARQTTSTSFIAPVSAAGATPVAGSDTAFGDNCRGVFTLVAGTTYYFDLGGADASILHALLQGDAAIVITSATIEETDLAITEAPITSNVAGQWFATDATRITSVAEGAGWSAASDVGATTGGAIGGVVWNVADHGARRTRIATVVGATGGEVRMCTWGKE